MGVKSSENNCRSIFTGKRKKLVSNHLYYYAMQSLVQEGNTSMSDISNYASAPCFEAFFALAFLTSIKDAALQSVLAMINIVISLFGTLANALVIIAYCRYPRLRTVQITILLLLAITDFGVTAFIQPIFVITILSALLGNNVCILQAVYVVLSFLFLELSLITVVILSLQSSITLAYPYRYQNIITKRRLIVVFVVSWLFVLLKSLLIFQLAMVTFYGSYFILCSTIFTVAITWCWTCKLVARHRKAIQSTQTPSNSENVAKKKILRSTITAFLIISSLLACYFLDLCFFFLQ